ncbi:SCO1860 family LAETG-anchored protein [Streptomyces sp. NPDC057877]|uniref:SCO1860 family LAETG-anchored protein n=1 Tax=Streptomyces sp. NPDC057877 TaxID=3346269 RepID=UPI0036D01F60
MNGNNSRLPARRLTAVATATVLAALTGAGTAHATDEGHASAVVLRTGLDVALLNKTVRVPLTVALNEVEAPASAEKTALTARLDGVDGGKPFTVLGADVAQAKATVTDTRAEASTHLAHAKVHVPGLPLLSVIEIEGVTSTATCEAGKAPVAESQVLGAVTVLGKRVSLTAGGPTNVTVPGVGEVRLDLSQRETTTRTASATALELAVEVNPLELNVAEVTGSLTLAEATCEAPPVASSVVPPAAPADVTPQGAPAEAGLAETGGSSATPYVAGGAVALLAVGGGAVALARRRRGGRSDYA